MVDTEIVPSKRAIARTDAAQLVDIESRLAPFFPQVASLHSMEAPDGEDSASPWTPPLR